MKIARIAASAGLLGCLLGSLLTFIAATIPVQQLRPFHRIAFGSCSNPNVGDAIWHLIDSFSPNQLVLLGDQIYADYEPQTQFKRSSGANAEQIEEEYRKFRDQKGFQKLLSSLTHQWVATIDDHDYGKNNGDKTFKYRNQSIELFHKYNSEHFDPFVELVDPATGTTTREKKSGVFSSHFFSFPSNVSKRQVNIAVVLLDVRSNKDRKGTVGGDFLGAQQWRWLEQELSSRRMSQQDLVLVGSGIQFLPDDKLVEENWGEFPAQRERILSLLARLGQRQSVLLLSGDIHSAELNQVRCHSTSARPSRPGEEEEVRLVELTSSGLSHTFSHVTAYWRMRLLGHQPAEILVRSRVYAARLFGLFYAWLYPAAYREDPTAHSYSSLHFALLDLAETRTATDAQLTAIFSVVNYRGETVMQKTFPLRRPSSAAAPSSSGDFRCVPVRGEVSAERVARYRGQLVAVGVVLLLLTVAAFVVLLRALRALLFPAAKKVAQTVEPHKAD